MRLFSLILCLQLVILSSAQSFSTCDALQAIPTTEKIVCHDAIEERIKWFQSPEGESTLFLFEDFKNRYDSLWLNYCHNYALPEEFRFLPLCLSHLDNNYKSPYKAGIWSLSPVVARRHGLTITAFYDERFNEDKATKVAFTYLKQLYNHYNEDFWQTVLAFANSPLELQENALTLNNDEDSPWNWYYSNLKEHSVIPNLITFIYLDSYYPMTNNKVHKTNYITILDTLSIEQFCKTLQMSITEFTLQNPAISSKSSFLYPDYEIILTSLQQQVFQEQLPQIVLNTKVEQTELLRKQRQREEELAKAKEPIIYRVKAGDTLGHIAQRHKVSVSDLKRWNKLKSDVLQIGQRLIIEQN